MAHASWPVVVLNVHLDSNFFLICSDHVMWGTSVNSYNSGREGIASSAEQGKLDTEH